MTILAAVMGFVFGASLGSYVPLALLYLAMPFLTHKFELRLVRQFLLRAGGVLVLLLLVMAAFGFLMQISDWPRARFDSSATAGLAVGFLSGVIAFVFGVRRGLRRRTSSQSA